MALTDEEELLVRLKKIEALHAGATTEGERAAAANVAEKVRARLKEFERIDPPLEYVFRTDSPYSRRVLNALLRRYGLEPFRRKGQRYSSVSAWVSKSFVDKVLWPEFMAITRELDQHLDKMTERIIGIAVHKNTADGAEVAETKRLI